MKVLYRKYVKEVTALDCVYIRICDSIYGTGPPEVKSTVVLIVPMPHHTG